MAIKRNKRVTRKSVSIPEVNNALNDVYDKIEELQPIEVTDIASATSTPTIGTTTYVNNPDGSTSIAMYTNIGWQVDINSCLVSADKRGLRPNEGTQSNSRHIANKEALKYNSRGNVLLQSPNRKKIILKNEGSTLKVRNSTDTSDAIVHAKKVKVSAVASAANEIGKGSDSTHGNKFLTVHDGSTLRHTVMMNDSGVIDVGPGGLKLKMADNNLAFYNSSTTGKGMDFDLSLVTDGQTRTLKCPDANGTIALTSDVTGDITGVTLTGDSGGALADTAGSADFTIAGGTNCATSGSGSTITINVDDAFLKNDADDTMAGALTIDKNTSGDAAENATGLQVDFDRTVASSGTNAHNDIGIDLDINSASLGTSSVKGMDIDVVGATTGTHTATGIELNVSGADDHVGLAITTPDGATGREDIKIHSSANASDYCTIATMAAGATTITTVDADSDSADFTLNADGDITLNSETGKFIAQKSGTEFSAANSAYAGMILGYTYLQPTDGTDTFEIQDSMTVEDAVHRITFKTPPSENVEIELSCFINVTSTDTNLDVGLSDSSTYNSIGGQFEYDFAGVYLSDDEADDDILTVKWVLSASELASVGSSNTFYIGFSTAGSTKTAYLAYGYRSSHGVSYPPFIVKATALPETIDDGS
tara:strand:- start:230 stop:2182 length:1953 start_codon:yes stop_codon:yes gene_type:complete